MYVGDEGIMICTSKLLSKRSCRFTTLPAPEALGRQQQIKIAKSTGRPHCAPGRASPLTQGKVCMATIPIFKRVAEYD